MDAALIFEFLYFAVFQFLAFLLITASSIAWSLKKYGQDQCIGLCFTPSSFFVVGIFVYCFSLVVILIIFHNPESYLFLNKGILYIAIAVCSSILSGAGWFFEILPDFEHVIEKEPAK